MGLLWGWEGGPRNKMHCIIYNLVFAIPQGKAIWENTISKQNFLKLQSNLLVCEQELMKWPKHEVREEKVA